MLYRIFILLLLVGCAQKHQINIGEITVNQGESEHLTVTDKYMSFTQEYYDNTKYPVSEYCNDKRAILTDDKFSTETYLKVTNERTKESRVGKYPIWFLVNDDARNIQCIKKSANFINEEPFVVSDNDKLTLKILQQNRDEKRVPIRELGVLIDLIGLVVPRTANFIFKSSNIINDPITRNYLNTIENAFKNGDLDGTKSREFTTQTEFIKITLSVPQEDLKQRELGYIILKPKYRTTLSTVYVDRGVPNFKYIFTTSDPRISDIMGYKLKSTGLTVKQEVDNFEHLADEYLIGALSRLNVHLLNRFTSYDRGLILALALRNSNLYRKFSQAVEYNNIREMAKYLEILNSKDNPLHDLSKLLNLTGIEYYRLMFEANRVVQENRSSEEERLKEQERIKQEEIKRQIELQGIENFLRPVARWSYIPQMFTKDAKVRDTEGNSYTLTDLQRLYNRESGVASYGCYTSLQNKIHGVSVQDYLIHPNYTDGINYDYMAISMDSNKTISTFFYKFNSDRYLKISNILIDRDGYFIMKSRLKEVLENQRAKMCYTDIISTL